MKMNWLQEYIKRLTKKMGISITRYPTHELIRKIQAYKTFKINTLLDVGANAGQYASLMRSLGYNGKIISFEPTSFAYDLLKQSADKDNNWTIHKMAVGSQKGEIEINISENSFSSSILDIDPLHVKTAPKSQYIDKEKVPIETLDNIFYNNNTLHGKTYLKIDTQGYEYEVLKGAENLLPSLECIQLEMGLIELYKGEYLFEDIVAHLKERGFGIYTIEPEFYNTSTGQLLQVDAIFYNKKSYTNIELQAHG